MGEIMTAEWENIGKTRGERMKVAEIITNVGQLRQNDYDLEQKTRWLSEVEGTIIDEIHNMAEGNDEDFTGYRYELDSEKETKLPDRFTDIYIHYIKAKIEFYDGETEQYNSEVAAYQSSYDQYAAWYRRNHMPKQPAKIIV